MATAWVGDDIFITFRSLEQLIEGNGPRFNPHERVQAFTHPLWFLLLLPARLVFGDPILGALALSFILSLATLFLLVRLQQRAGGPGWLTLALLFSSRAWVDYLSSGLETPLINLLLTLCLLRWLTLSRDLEAAALGSGGPSTPWNRQLLSLVTLASLAVLTRFDLAILLLPMALQALVDLLRGRHLSRWGAVRVVGVGSLPFVAWSLFSVTYFGFLLPNTAYAKLATGLPQAELWRQGGSYLLHFSGWDPVGFAVVTAGLGCALWLRGRWLAPALGMLGYGVYVLRVGGDFMAGRFFVPLLVFGAVALSVTLARVGRQRQAVLVLLAFTVLFPFSLLKGLGPREDRSNVSGIVDERGIYSRHLSLLSVLERPPPMRIAVGPITEAKSIGRLGYASALDQILIDRHGLTDPLLARLGALRPWRIGHFERAMPRGYRESLESGDNRIRNPYVRSLYDDVVSVTRGPLFSVRRWQALVRLNLRRDFPRCSDPPCRDLRVSVRAREFYKPVWPSASGELFRVRAMGTRVIVAGRFDLADDDPHQTVTLIVPSKPVRRYLRPEFLRVSKTGASRQAKDSEGRFRLVIEFPDKVQARAAEESLCLVAESEYEHPHIVGSSRPPCRELLYSP